jgi:formylglycine-generating enzyme required for sulfatase activity
MPSSSVSTLLLRWQEAFEQGIDLSAAELCPDDPALAQRLEPALENLRQINRMVAHSADSVSAVPSCPDVGPATVSPGADYREVQSAKGQTPTAELNGQPPTGLCVPGYEILGELGRGGMGVVYKAQQVALDRVVALKMILAGGHASPAELARFQSEAKAIARLQHPNIVQVHEVGEHEGKPYFSLEFCNGGNLDRKLSGNPLPAENAATLVMTLARAMQAAHDAHIIHRDLKPANILLLFSRDAESSERSATTPRSAIASRLNEFVPKITDFGLAKKLDEAGQTQTGAVMGTPSYMAPEQAAGKKDIGPAADVYALGAILYECLTGRPPFRAATAFDTLKQVVSEEPVPPRRLNAEVPLDLETVALKCLEKEPSRRYTSAEDLAADLRRFHVGEPIRARPVGAVERAVKWARRRPALAALTVMSVTAVLALLAGGLWFNARLAEQRNGALQEADIARKARDFLASIFDLSDPENHATFSPFKLLDRAEQRIPIEFADHPQLRADLMATLEDARSGLGAPAGMLLEVRGAVELHLRKGAMKQAAPSVLVFPGDRLCLLADARVRLIVLSDLHQEWLAPGREATVSRKGCVPAEVVGRSSKDAMMTFVRLPKGAFYMGADKHKAGKKTEIKEDFEIAVYAVTQGQWQAVMGYNPSEFSRQGANQGSLSGISEEELKLFPVENVSWDDAQEFIEKLNEKERAGGYLYHLPTEAEWEYACRGGATSEKECSFRFYLDKPSNNLSTGQANFHGDIPLGKGNYLGRPTRVGSYPPNKLGLCDMHGNMRQWCEDLVTPANPTRALRGGSWCQSAIDCAAAERNSDGQWNRVNYNGFRLARIPVR